MVKPNCPRCQGTRFTGTSTSFNGVNCVVVYCMGCGAAIGVVAKPL
jgi:hypothetical protein